MEQTKEKDGFDGVFFRGTHYPSIVIIRVGGTGARKEQVISSSQFLMDAGFSVLCLGYQSWNSPQSPTSLIPLDYVSYAIDWIYRNVQEPHIKIGMTGISMGALYALAASCFVPQISAIALASPFDHVMEGLDKSLNPTGHSTFTWKNKELPYQPWTIFKRKKRSIFLDAFLDEGYGTQRLLRYVYDHNPWSVNSTLPIERIKADTLLLASKDDDCWPSDKAVSRLISRLQSSQVSSQKVEYILYEKGCHNMGGNMSMSGLTGLKMHLLMKSWRTHPDECRACIEDSKKQIVDFFNRSLNPSELSIKPGHNPGF